MQCWKSPDTNSKKKLDTKKEKKNRTEWVENKWNDVNYGRKKSFNAVSDYNNKKTVNPWHTRCMFRLKAYGYFAG